MSKSKKKGLISVYYLGTEEQDRLTLRPSARSTILLPLGQITWSTCTRVITLGQDDDAKQNQA